MSRRNTAPGPSPAPGIPQPRRVRKINIPVTCLVLLLFALTAGLVGHILMPHQQASNTAPDSPDKAAAAAGQKQPDTVAEQSRSPVSPPVPVLTAEQLPAAKKAQLELLEKVREIHTEVGELLQTEIKQRKLEMTEGKTLETSQAEILKNLSLPEKRRADP